MGWIASQLEFVMSMASSLRELLSHPEAEKQASPVLEAFEADTIEQMFMRDGMGWTAGELRDTSRLLTLATYHRIALGEISRSLLPPAPETPTIERTDTSWIWSEHLEIANLSSEVPGQALDDHGAEADARDDVPPMASGEITARLLSIPGLGTSDRGTRISLLPIIAIPLLLLSRPLEARAPEGHETSTVSEAIESTSSEASHSPEPEAPSSNTSSEADAVESAPETEPAIESLTEARGDAAEDALESAVASEAPSASSHSGTPIALLAPGAEAAAVPVTITTESGVTVIIGTHGNDHLIGTDGNDIMLGGVSDDVIEGGIGADIINGDIGSDTASYAHSSEAVTVDLGITGAQVSGGDASGDVLISIENIVGSAHDDTLTGDDAANVIEGGNGADIIDGSDGTDTVSYQTSTEGVTVTLSLDAAQSSPGDAAGDVLTNVENLVGSAHDDTLTGDDGANVIEGGAGADVIDGSDGTDTVSYASSTAGVTVDLSLETAQSSPGDAAGDVLVNVENIVGSAHDDTLTGGDGANTLAGGDGNDTFIVTDSLDIVFEETMGGTDIVKAAIDYYTLPDNVENLTYTGSGEATLTGNDIDNIILGGSLSDIIVGEGGNDRLCGGDGDDEIHGDDGDDWISGGSGTNSLDGGTGNDWLITFEGSDTLVLRPGFGNDVVEGFGSRGHGSDTFDEIDVSAYGFDEDSLGIDIQIYAIGDDAVISIGNDTLTLLDTRVKDIGKSDFIFG